MLANAREGTRFNDLNLKGTFLGIGESLLGLAMTPLILGWGVFVIAIFGFILLLVYGIAVIVFRVAFGVELPNPLDWIR